MLGIGATDDHSQELSCAHWLHWRTGIDLGAAREKVRVARALPVLPGISAAMRHGWISYAKVRALTRVATPENEERLLTVALSGTAAHVERIVRAWRLADALAASLESARRDAARALDMWVDDDRMLVIRGRLSPEAGAVVQRAVEAAADRIWRESAGARDGDAGMQTATAAQRRADALVLVAETALSATLDTGTAGDRYQVVVHRRHHRAVHRGAFSIRRDDDGSDHRARPTHDGSGLVSCASCRV